MNDFLFVLFYQAIVAVNTAVIISGIIWLAKRKDGKEERKPNPDFTPLPEKKPPAPPTTGTSAIKPKKRKYDEYSALPYAVSEAKNMCRPIMVSTVVQAENGKIIIPTEESGTPVSGYRDGKIYGYVQTLVSDDGNNDRKAYPINPRTGEVEGYPAIDGTVYRVYFWTCGKAAQTVHVNPYSGPDKIEALKEAPKQTATGTNVIEPKPTTDERCFNCVLFRWQKQKGGEQIFKPYCVVKQRPIEKDPWGGKCCNYVRESYEGMAAKDYDDLNYKPQVRKEIKKLFENAKFPPPMHIPTEGAKERKGDEFFCLCAPFSNLTREQVLDGLDRYIKGFRPNDDLLDRVENEMKRIKDDQRAGTQPIQSFIGEVRGGPGNEVMGTVTAKSAEELEEKLKALADRLDRVEKKPVTAERMKEAGFEVEPVNVFDPAEESVKRYEARTAQLPHYCGNCIAHRQEKFDGEIVHMCMRHKVWLHNQERWDGGCDAWEPSPSTCKLYKEWADGFCSSCKYFEPEEPGQKHGMGLCARNDEIKMMGQSCAGYAKKGELPKYLERQPMERPEPLGNHNNTLRREKTMNDKTCEECLYCKNGKCFLEILDGSDAEECRGQNYKWFEAREE